MKILARAILALTIVLWLAAIWILENWLQLLLTGTLTLIVGASILGQKTKA